MKQGKRVEGGYIEYNGRGYMYVTEESYEDDTIVITGIGFNGFYGETPDEQFFNVSARFSWRIPSAEFQNDWENNKIKFITKAKFMAQLGYTFKNINEALDQVLVDNVTTKQLDPLPGESASGMYRRLIAELKKKVAYESDTITFKEVEKYKTYLGDLKSRLKNEERLDREWLQWYL